MIVCTLVCEGCRVDLAVARHEDDCDEPQAHGALLVGSEGHLLYHADCCTLSVTTETLADAEERWTREDDERRAGLARDLETAQARAEIDRARWARLGTGFEPSLRDANIDSVDVISH